MRNKGLLTLIALLVIASMVLVGCGGGAAEPAPAPTAAPPVEEPTATPAPVVEEPTATSAPVVEEPTATPAPVVEEPTATPEPVEEPTVDISASGSITSAQAMAAAEAALAAGKVPIRWFVGLGTGTSPYQLEVQSEVVKEFNESQDEIELILEIIPYNAARDTLSTQIASGNGPDIIGPVGVGGSNAFYGQWLDLAPLIEKAGYDTTQFNEELVKFYQTEEGQVGLPFAVFPGALFFQKAMFDEADLNYPPTEYGAPYVLPDGTEVEWSFETLTNIAKYLTVDANGNAVVDLVDGEFVANPDFDNTQIVQYGYVPQYQRPAHQGSFWGAGTVVADDGTTAQIPEQWQAAWKWWHDGIWGDEPFIPSNPVYQSPEFGAGNPFNSGKVAMAITQAWYTCCVAEAGDSWDLAVMPTYDGKVNGRIDADTYRIWKGTQNPDEAFEVLSYLIGPASLKLLETYGGMPSRAEDVDAYFATKSEQYPFVENWEVLTEGLAYPDIPSAEGYMPCWNEGWNRLETLYSLIESEPEFDMDAEIASVQSDLQDIFDKCQE